MQVVDDVLPYTPIRDLEAAGSVILAILIVGFPIVLGLSWFLELTPPAVRRELPAEEFPSARPSMEHLRSDSVAVLPFANLSESADNEYFSDGITDDIIAAIAHVRGLRVMSRTSVWRYKGTDRAMAEIAAALGTATIVTGSVRRSGSRVRIFAEVVDARSEDMLWSDTYERELEDIFEIQSEVAAQVARAVQQELTVSDAARIASRGTTNPEAYDIYLKARFLWNQRTGPAIAESLGYFERALELDPDFALAYSGLAEAHTVRGLYGMESPTTVFEAAKDAADEALRLDPMLGEAVAAKACVAGIFDWDWEVAERGFWKAFELAPSYPTARQWYAMNILTPHAKFTEAKEELSRASELDPGSRAIAIGDGIIAFYARDYGAAHEELEAVRWREPDFSLAHFFLGQCYAAQGDDDRAIDSLEEAVKLAGESSETLGMLGYAYGRVSRTTESEAVLDRLRQRAERRYVSPVLFAQVLIGLGRHDDALAELAEAAKVSATDLIWLAVRPLYDPVRDRDEFQAVLEEVDLRVGLRDKAGARAKREAPDDATTPS